MKARDILNILLSEVKKQGIQLQCLERVQKLEWSADHWKVHTQNNILQSKIVVVATGGKSYPSTGSTGDAYSWAQEMGHTIVPPCPGLTPLLIQDYPFAELAGISFSNIPFSLWRDAKKCKTGQGDVLFTHQGLSGPGILDFSRYVRAQDEIKLNFVKAKDFAAFNQEFLDFLDAHRNKTLGNSLRELELPRQFIRTLFEQYKISTDLPCCQCNKIQRKQLIHALTEYSMVVQDLGGFEIAMVTQGGVALADINPKTMESLKQPGLYFIGEVLDIDGDTGGYNLQAAFSTAKLAAMAISKSLMQQ